jgi:NOL1/NOP2/fmu family ribosome biogenesis protein
LAGEEDRRELLSYLEARFGIDANHFEGYIVLKRKNHWSFFRHSPLLNAAGKMKVAKVGIRAFRRVGSYVKPTTRLIQMVGRWATKARIGISQEELSRLLSGGRLDVNLPLDPGYVILDYPKGRPIGLGLFVDGQVRSQIPRKEMRAVMLSQPSS